MKFILKQSNIQSALQKIVRVIPTRSVNPILNNILISTTTQGISLRATDLEVTLVILIPAIIEKQGTISIDNKLFYDITNSLPECDMCVEADENYKISIETQFGTYRTSGLSPDDFPATPDVDNKKEISISANALLRLIDNTVYTIELNESKPALMGTLLEVKEDRISTVGTDGHKMAVCERNDFTSSGFTGDVVIPRKFLSLLRQNLTKQGTVTMWVGDKHITVTVGDATLFSRIIEEKYPDYRAVIPKDNDKTLTANNQDFLASLKRVSIFANKATRQITLRLSNGGCQITTEDPETASGANEELHANYNGDDILIGYNASYLSEFLSHINSENVVIKLKTPISAGVITPEKQAENENITMLLMPMRISG